MNRFAVLAPGFEHLSYPLGRRDACEGQSFSERSELFTLARAQSEEHAQMALVSAEGLSEHSAKPVGYVCSEKGETFLVCKNSGREGKSVAPDERAALSFAVMERLAMLHSQGFGCGGLSPEAVEFAGREAKLLNPSLLFALTEEDSVYYEAVATLRALASSGMARKSDLPLLASAYLSHSPVCRHGVSEHLRKKKVRAQPAAALADAAKKLVPYF
jgi:hypothetical protein